MTWVERRELISDMIDYAIAYPDSPLARLFREPDLLQRFANFLGINVVVPRQKQLTA